MIEMINDYFFNFLKLFQLKDYYKNFLTNLEIVIG